MLGRLIAVAAIILFLAAAVPIVQQGQWESSTASQAQHEFNDTISVKEGNVSGLASSNKTGIVYAPQHDITVQQGGTVVEQPGNWTWIRSNGTVLIGTGTAFDTARQANVSGYFTRPSAAQNTTTTIGLLPSAGFGEAWLLMGMVVLVLGALGVAARLA